MAEVLERTPVFPAPAGEGMRVAVISMHTSPTAPLGRLGNGGMNVYVREVCRRLAERGVATDVYTAADAAASGLAEGSRVIQLPLSTPGHGKYALLDQVPAFADALVAHAARDHLSYDLVYSHYWLSGAVARLVHAELEAAWVHTAHTLGIVKNRSLAIGAQPEPESRIQVERQVARSADLLIASTEAERSALIDDYGADPRAVAVVQPGVDLAVFSPQPLPGTPIVPRLPERFLLFVGRLERLKGAETALRALSLLGDEYPDLCLVVVGEDSGDAGESELSRLRDVAAGLGLGSRVQFHRAVEHELLPAYFRAALACVVPSHSESFGLVALEAQACGCPVVAANVPGLASIVRDGVSGFLIDGWEAGAYAQQLRLLLRSPELREQMGRRATVLAQRFDWPRTVGAILANMTRVMTQAQLGVQVRSAHE